jgi:hypothetical protein
LTAVFAAQLQSGSGQTRHRKTAILLLTYGVGRMIEPRSEPRTQGHLDDWRYAQYKRKRMNILGKSVLLMGALASTACTTLKAQEATPEELQPQLLCGSLLQPGDRVRLVTADETVHEFRVTEIDFDQGLVIGRDERVAIADVVAVETREVSIGRTALLVGGVGYSVVAIVLMALAPALILGGG